MVIRYIVQIVSSPETRWWAAPEDLRRFLQAKADVVAMRWSEGPLPTVEVITDEVADVAARTDGVIRVHP
jgi:hypothetical protein